MIGQWWKKVRENHFAMMAVCCLLPVIAIVALKALGIDSPWVYGAAILLCLGSHVLMMMRTGGEKSCH